GRRRGEPHALLPPGCQGGGAARSDRRAHRGSTVSGIQVVNQAETAWLRLITDVDMTLRLYTNDVLAGLTDVEIEALTEAAFTEATFPGYTPVALTNPWTIVPGNPSKATVPQQSFTRTSTGTAELIYGYYLTRVGDGALMWFEQFDGPVSMEF